MVESREEVIEALDNALRASMGDRHFRNTVTPLIQRLVDMDTNEAMDEIVAVHLEADDEPEEDATVPEVMAAEAILEDADRDSEE